MKYRSRTDIVALILAAANGGASKRKIMYSTIISYSQLKEYLTFLIERGLVQYDEETRIYDLTEKGIRVLRTCNEIEEMVAVGKNKTARAVVAAELPKKKR